MTAIQTSMSAAPARGVPGQEYDAGFNDVVTKLATEAIPFGVLVACTAAGTCELPDSSGEVTTAGGVGISLLDHNKASQGGYAIGDPVRVLQRGRVFVLAEETITHGDAVYARHTATPPEQKGAFRNDADTTDATIPPGMRWFQGGTTTNPPVLEVGYGGSAGPTGATGATGPTGPTGPTG